MEKENRKRFPAFDLILLLVIAAAVAVGVLWSDRAREKDEVGLVYTVTFSGVDTAYGGCLSEGKTLYGTDGVRLGEIGRVSGSASVLYSFDRTPKEDEVYYYTQTRSSDRLDITVTVTVLAERRADGYYVGDRQIAAGLELECMVSGFSGTGLIRSAAEETAE